MKLLDSDHCVAILRGELNLRGRVPADETLALTSISVAELMHGAFRSNRVEENITRLEVLLSAVVILPFEEYAARRFGLLKSELETQGSPLADLDLQIASIALENDLPLVTHNQRHFSKIEELQLLDWIG